MIGTNTDSLEDHYHAEAVDKRRKQEQEIKKARMLEERGKPLVTVTHKIDPNEMVRRALREREKQDRESRGVRI